MFNYHDLLIRYRKLMQLSGEGGRIGGLSGRKGKMKKPSAVIIKVGTPK
jgi:hypothetical protein